VAGEAEGNEAENESLETIPAVDALLELDDMFIPEFGRALKAGASVEVVGGVELLIAYG
jgi:hypothetical protein